MAKTVTMAVLCLVLFTAWIYALTVFRRRKLEFFYYITGSVGSFLFIFFLFKKPLSAVLTRFTCLVTGSIGHLLGICDGYASRSMLFMTNADGPISLYVDFECGGVIEILVFLCLLWFFGVYGIKEKLGWSFLGTAWIMGANVIRLLSICIVVNEFGNESYYIAHSVVGRLLFYALTIGLYFYAFTRAQIKRQKVGEFDYGKDAVKPVQ